MIATGERGKRSRITGDLLSGPKTLPENELIHHRAPLWDEIVRHPFDDDYYKERSAHWERVKTPLLSCGNWGGQGLHLRGNIEGFLRAASEQKWPEVHGGPHWAIFYTDYAVKLQKRFFDYFLKGAKNGWDKQPRVQLQVRHVDRFVERFENEWPLARTLWTKLYIDPANMALCMDRPCVASWI
jgi:predicted acyl esterase